MSSYVLNKQIAEVAQSVEQGTENPRVSGSIPFLGISFCDISFPDSDLAKVDCISYPEQIQMFEIQNNYPCRTLRGTLEE